jgi:hypothetical protein
MFVVESRTTPGTHYVADARTLTCTCAAGQLHRRCWHVTLAILKTEQKYPRRPQGMAALAEAFGL